MSTYSSQMRISQLCSVGLARYPLRKPTFNDTMCIYTKCKDTLDNGHVRAKTAPAWQSYFSMSHTRMPICVIYQRFKISESYKPTDKKKVGRAPADNIHHSVARFDSKIPDKSYSQNWTSTEKTHSNALPIKRKPRTESIKSNTSKNSFNRFIQQTPTLSFLLLQDTC